MAIAKGKSIERKLIKEPNVNTVYSVIYDLLKDFKIVNIQYLVNALSNKPLADEKFEDTKISQIIEYFDAVYDYREVSKAFIETLCNTSSENSQTFIKIYHLYVKPYFEYMVRALDLLDKNDIESYIRSLEKKIRSDYTLQDASYIDQYISKLTELGYSIDGDEIW